MLVLDVDVVVVLALARVKYVWCVWLAFALEVYVVVGGRAVVSGGDSVGRCRCSRKEERKEEEGW